MKRNWSKLYPLNSADRTNALNDSSHLPTVFSGPTSLTKYAPLGVSTTPARMRKFGLFGPEESPAIPPPAYEPLTSKSVVFIPLTVIVSVLALLFDELPSACSI